MSKLNDQLEHAELFNFAVQKAAQSTDDSAVFDEAGVHDSGAGKIHAAEGERVEDVTQTGTAEIVAQNGGRSRSVAVANVDTRSVGIEETLRAVHETFADVSEHQPHVCST